ncbi:BON domain-containing protein [Streptomyces sp. NPDC055005]
MTTDIRQSVVKRLFSPSHESVKVAVFQGIATLTGHVKDRDLIRLAGSLTHSVEGTVDVHCRLDAPPEA